MCTHTFASIHIHTYTKLASAFGPSALLELGMLPPMGLPGMEKTNTYTLKYTHSLMYPYTYIHAQSKCIWAVSSSRARHAALHRST